MNLSYFDYCKKELLSIFEYLDKKDYYALYKKMESLIEIFSITYFCLSEEMIINKDMNNNDVNSKYDLMISNKTFENLFAGELSSYINIKEKLTDSKLWFVSALRNSILHGSSVIDLENHMLHVDNKAYLNKLIATIDFKWFINYFNYIDINDIFKKNFVFYYTTILELQKKPLLSKESLNSKDTFNVLNSFVLKVEEKSGENLQRVSKDELLRFTLNKIDEYTKQYNRVFENEFWREHDFANILKNIIPKLESETDIDYESRIYKEYIKMYLEGEYNTKYPNYKIDITFLGYDLHKILTPEESEYLFSINDANKQYRMLNNTVNNKLLSKDFLSDLNYFKDFFHSIFECKWILNDENFNEEWLCELLNKENYQDYVDFVHKKNKQNNEVVSFDKKILTLILTYDFEPEEELYGRLIFDYIYNTYSIGEIHRDNLELIQDVKSKFPYFFEKYTKIFTDKDYYTDKDIDIYYDIIYDGVKKIKEQILESEKEIIKTAIYLLGINLFVLNKENVFDKSEYAFMDELIYEGYSEAYYKSVGVPLENNLKKCKEKIRVLNKKLENENLPQHTKQNFTSAIHCITTKKEKIEKELNEQQIKSFNGIKMSRIYNGNCATIIRNCLSHPERINLTEDNILEFCDYDAKESFTGFVKMPVDSAIEFFSHDDFRKKLENEKKQK